MGHSAMSWNENGSMCEAGELRDDRGVRRGICKGTKNITPEELVKHELVAWPRDRNSLAALTLIDSCW